MVLYSSIQAATRVLAAAWAGKSSRDRNSNSSVEWNDSMTALSSAGPAHGLADPHPVTCPPEETRGVLAALIGRQDHAGDLAAADRGRHGQRPVGQLRVMMPGQGEPRIRRELTSRTLARYSWPSAVWIPVPAPNHFLVDLLRGEVAAGQVRCALACCRPFPGRVSALRFFFRRAARCCSRITAATVFWFTAQPARRAHPRPARRSPHPDVAGRRSPSCPGSPR
jgi:hypothetical protein